MKMKHVSQANKRTGGRVSTTTEEPVIAQKGPYKVELLGGYRYAWCACGLSKWQPFCDGSHTGSKVPGIKPLVWTQEKDQTALLCGCKRSAKFPFCDASHKKL
jgi:CDGSH iron-sulfur domain-containing protein 3